MCFRIWSYGCSTFSSVASTTLSYIIPENTSKYIAQAKEASMSRLYAAIHYRRDCEEDLEADNKVGNYAFKRGHIDGAE